MFYVCEQDQQGLHMAEAAFNTIAEIQRLRDAGIEQKQAEAITLSIHAGVTGGVATKADVDSVEQRLDGKIDLLRKDVVNGDESLKSEIDLLRKDVEKAEERLDGKIDTATATLRAEIATANFNLTWRLIGSVAILNGIFLALSRYMATPPAG